MKKDSYYCAEFTTETQNILINFSANGDFASDDVEFVLSENDIASLCSVSVSTAQRSFVKEYSKTIMAYKNELRFAKWQKPSLLSAVASFSTKACLCETPFI